MPGSGAPSLTSGERRASFRRFRRFRRFTRTWPVPVVITAFGAASEGPYPVPDHLAAEIVPVPLLPAGQARSIGSEVLKAALGRTLAHPGLGSLPDPEERALVVGSQSSTLNEVAQFLEEVDALGAHLVNPGLFPFTVMNAPAGLTAIEYECRGANITLNHGASSAIDALVCAADQVVAGNAAIAFAGGFESYRLAGSRQTAAIAALFAVTTLSRALAGGARAAAELRSCVSGPEDEAAALSAGQSLLNLLDAVRELSRNQSLDELALGAAAEAGSSTTLRLAPAAARL